MKIFYGDFGEKYCPLLWLTWDYSGSAGAEIQAAAGGRQTYNVKLTTTIAPTAQGDTEDDDDSQQKKAQFSSFGIVFDEGRQLAMKAFTGVSTLRKITEAEMEKILNDCDPIEAPPGEYKIQPEKQG